MRETFTLPPHYRVPDGTPQELAASIRELMTQLTGLPDKPAPSPTEKHGCGMFIADPAQADQLEQYAREHRGQVHRFYGFKFITLEHHTRTMEKLRMIGRLEAERKTREARREAG